MRHRVSSLGVGVRAPDAASSPCDPTTPEPWLPLKAACQYAGFNERTLRRRARDGLLPHGKLGRNLRFKATDIDTMLRQGGAS